MDNFNRVISFVLGLVVVIVFFAVLTGKLKLPGKLGSPFAKTSPTPTPTKSINPTPISTVRIENETSGRALGNSYKTQSNSSAAKSIPSTGLPTLFIPTLLSGALGGSFLRKTGKKRS